MSASPARPMRTPQPLSPLHVASDLQLVVPRMVEEKRGLLTKKIGRIDAYHLKHVAGEGAQGKIHKALTVAEIDMNATTSACSNRRSSLGSFRGDDDDGKGKGKGKENAKPRTQVALKMIKLDNKDRVERVVREATLQARCHDHPNIVKVLDLLQGDQHVVVVMELARGGDLFPVVTRSSGLEVDKATLALAQVCLAVQHLHNRDVAHCDIKPENVLLRRENDLSSVLLCDFGHAVRWKDSDRLQSRVIGTVRCLPPEMFAVQEGEERQYSPKAVDVWALGVLGFFLVSAQFPFDGKDDSETARNVVYGTYTAALPAGVPAEYKTLLEGMLDHRPAHRLTINQVCSNALIQEHAARLESA